MKIIFLPQHFPGPFRYTAAKLAADKTNKVIFVTDRSRRDVRIPGVRRILVSIPQSQHIPDRAELESVRSIKRGTQIANALLHLKNTGFIPDVIIANAGFGCSLYTKDIFPEAFLSIYAESYQANSSMFTTLKTKQTYPTVNFSPDRIRNLFQWDAFNVCQMAFTSTNWQKSTYPEVLSNKIEVLHEGIDTNFFSPEAGQKFQIDGCDLSHAEELITFSGRSIDTRRNFPQFLHSIPQILEQRPKCHILVMAGSQDKENSIEDAWYELLRNKYTIDTNRVKFLNFRPYKDYRMMLRASSVHVFLSTPNALSTGLFEAMSCGCLVAAGDTDPVREVVEHGKNGFLYDIWNAQSLTETVVGILENKDNLQPLREVARKAMCKDYDSFKQTQKNVKTILSNYSNWKNK